MHLRSTHVTEVCVLQLVAQIPAVNSADARTEMRLPRMHYTADLHLMKWVSLTYTGDPQGSGEFYPKRNITSSGQKGEKTK